MARVYRQTIANQQGAAAYDAVDGLTDAGVNTALGMHTANVANPHAVSAAQAGADAVGSAAAAQAAAVAAAAADATAKANAAQAASDPAGSAAAAVAAHAALGDPHTGYQLEAEKGAANGYMGLGAGGLADPSDLPAATDAVQGAVELATAAEVTTGTDTGRAVTPAGLGPVTAFARTVLDDGDAATARATLGTPDAIVLAGIAGFTTTDALLLAEHDHALAAVADLIALPGAGVWDGTPANLASALIAGGLIQVDHGDVATDDWWNGTYTSPFYRFLVDRQPGLPLIVETHIACPQGDDASNYNFGGVMIAAADTDATFVRATLGFNASRRFGAGYGPNFGFGADILGLTTPQWATGYWVLFIVRPDHAVEILRVAGAVGAPPALADYQTHGVVAGIFDGSDTRLRVGISNGRPPATTVGLRYDIGALRIRGGQLVEV